MGFSVAVASVERPGSKFRNRAQGPLLSDVAGSALTRLRYVRCAGDFCQLIHVVPLEASGQASASSEFCYGPRFSGKLAPLEALGIYHRVNVLQVPHPSPALRPRRTNPKAISLMPHDRPIRPQPQYNTDADSIGAVVCANAQKLQVRRP